MSELAEQLKRFCESINLSPNARRGDLVEELDDIENEMNSLNEELCDLDYSLESAQRELRELDAQQDTIIDFEELLREVKGISNVREINIERDCLELVLDDLKLGSIPLPPYIVRIEYNYSVIIYLKHTSLKYDHPHVSFACIPNWDSVHIDELLIDFDLVGVILEAIRFLQSYNYYRSYIDLREWIRELSQLYYRSDPEYSKAIVDAWNNTLDQYQGIPYNIFNGVIKPLLCPVDNQYIQLGA